MRPCQRAHRAERGSDLSGDQLYQFHILGGELTRFVILTGESADQPPFRGQRNTEAADNLCPRGGVLELAAVVGDDDSGVTRVAGEPATQGADET